MRGAVQASAGCALLLVAALRLVACGGDDASSPPDPLSGSDADLPERNVGPDPDPNDDGSTTVVIPPSFCDGIVFYASLDGTYGPELGATPGSAFGNARLVSNGKFGGATSLLEEGGTSDAGAAVHYYTPPDGGVPWYPDKVGTVSLWYRGEALEEDGAPVLWRVVGAIPPDPVVGGGLALVSFGAEFGLVAVNNAQQTQTILTFPRTSIRPYVNRADYNHFVSGWQRGDAATPTAVMMINGGTGKVFDASADAPSYADAQPNEAGDLLVPYRASRARGWDIDASPRAFRLGGTGASAAEGDIDDVVVWNRLLSFSEMAALYATTSPVGDVCKLK
jgi:hypothetical protein